MKSDLTNLMRLRGLDALIVNGPDGLSQSNAAYNYLIAPARDINGTVIVKVSGEIYLLHRTMERDEAAVSGLKLINREQFNVPAIMKEQNGDRLATEVELLRRIFNHVGIPDDGSARVGFYGVDVQNRTLAMLDRVRREELCEVVVEFENDAITEARMTKDEGEAAQIRRTCDLTSEVIGLTKDFIRAHTAKDRAMVKADGAPLTIGDLKRFVRLRCSELELEEDHTILAIGRDAGVPHSRGKLGDVIRLGETIIFDIFPRQLGGYYADITRTWCVGHAPDHVLQAYEQVCNVHDTVEGMFAVGRHCHEFHEAACEMFREMGHPTQLDGQAITSGYMHGLGHGFGLSVHESPSMSLKGMRPDELIQSGTIICNEPGLYYPDDPRGGWGVRLEDDYWFDLAGTMHKLTNVDRELIIKI